MITDHAPLETLRIRAVTLVQKEQSTEVVGKALGLNRTTIYDWRALYRRVGESALKTRPVQGRLLKLTGRQLNWISGTVTRKNPMQLKFEFAQWTRQMVASLIKDRLSAVLFIKFLKRLIVGAKKPVYLIVDRSLAHIAKKTKAFVETPGGMLKLFYFPPCSPDRNSDGLVWKHLKADTIGRMVTTSKADFKTKVVDSMRRLQKCPEKI